MAYRVESFLVDIRHDMGSSAYRNRDDRDTMMPSSREEAAILSAQDTDTTAQPQTPKRSPMDHAQRLLGFGPIGSSRPTKSKNGLNASSGSLPSVHAKTKDIIEYKSMVHDYPHSAASPARDFERALNPMASNWQPPVAYINSSGTPSPLSSIWTSPYNSSSMSYTERDVFGMRTYRAHQNNSTYATGSPNLHTKDHPINSKPASTLDTYGLSPNFHDQQSRADTRSARVLTALVLPPAPRSFRPTDMILQRQAPRNEAPVELEYEPKGTYRGDMTSSVNIRQVQYLADRSNCTLWLCNISPFTSVGQIFDLVADGCHGAVFCLHVMPPDDFHSTCAAKLSFFDPEAAASFKKRADGELGIWFHSKKLRVMYNRDGNLRSPTNLSRCIRIEGPAQIMTLEYWYTYFSGLCVFQWDRVHEVACSIPGRKAMVFAFVRVTGQSQCCLKAIQAQDEFTGQVKVAYQADPCGDRWARALEENGARVY